MSVRADAHFHFFHPGYVATLPENCRRIQPDEVTLYQALAQQYGVQQVLAVGYEGESWAVGNNQYLAQIAASHSWVKPVAYVQKPETLSISTLERWQQERFVGLSIYVFDEAMIASINQVPEEVWVWLAQRHWLVSVNSRGENWTAWLPVLKRYPELRLIVSHLGLPQAMTQAPAETIARQELGPVLALAKSPGVRVKLSGFYALTKPGYDYPHRAAWPYVEALLADFGSSRLLWGSDFSPSLEWVSFPQTFGLFADMPFLDTTDIERIEGGNLLTLLTEITDS